MLGHVLLAVIVVGSLLAQRPSTAPGQPHASACTGDVEPHFAELRRDAHALLRAIRSNDSKTILGFFGDSVSLGADHLASHKDIERQFSSNRGVVYETFFDTPQLKARLAGTIVESNRASPRSPGSAQGRAEGSDRQQEDTGVPRLP